MFFNCFLGGFKLKLKTILLVLTGFFVGVMLQDSISQLRWRNIAVGGEVLFVPTVFLLVWLGWILREEYIKVRRAKNGNTRKKS